MSNNPYHHTAEQQAELDRLGIRLTPFHLPTGSPEECAMGYEIFSRYVGSVSIRQFGGDCIALGRRLACPLLPHTALTMNTPTTDSPTPSQVLISAISLLEHNGAVAKEIGAQLREAVAQLERELTEARAEVEELKDACRPAFIRSEAIRNCREEIATLRAQCAAREEQEAELVHEIHEASTLTFADSRILARAVLATIYGEAKP